MSIFTQIHEILFYGKGGYDYTSVYNMPVWLRRFTWLTMKEHYDAESGASSDDYLVNEGVIQRAGAPKPKIPDAVKEAASNYKVKAPKPKK